MKCSIKTQSGTQTDEIPAKMEDGKKAYSKMYTVKSISYIVKKRSAR